MQRSTCQAQQQSAWIAGGLAAVPIQRGAKRQAGVGEEAQRVDWPVEAAGVIVVTLNALAAVALRVSTVPTPKVSEYCTTDLPTCV